MFSLNTKRIETCPHCKAPLDDSLIICTNCGTAILKKPGFFSHLIISALLGGILFTIGYFLLFQNISLSSGMLSDHTINLVVIYVALWKLMFIVLKTFEYFRQKKALEYFKSHEILEIFLGKDPIDLQKIEPVLSDLHKHLRKKGFSNPLGLIIFERVRKTLYFLKSVPHREEISSTLSYQAEIDQSRIDVEFKIMKVFNWALPTMGFFGTVLGMGKAINKFSSFLSNAGTEVTTEAIKSNLTGVVSGLGMAFDSTMLALLFLLLLLPLGAYLENQYNGLLNQIEEYLLTFITPNLLFKNDVKGKK